MLARGCALLLGAFCLVAQTRADQYTASPTVTLASGVLEGLSTKLPSATAAVNQFLGVPFAASPPKRFEPPEAPESWDAPLQVKNFTAACVQQFNYPEPARSVTRAIFNNPGGAAPAESEDCLYLNVYAPSSAPPPGGRTVMFWIYGGAFQFGTAMQMGYDATNFASNQDVIVVVINYRTNVFGFSSAPHLPLASRNAGLLDQRMALQWVQDNIAQFGGDPDKVTIFGESAGAFSVDLLVTSYGKHPPFRAAIMESGQSTYGSNAAPNNDVGLASWRQLVQLLNCTGDVASQQAYECVQRANATAVKSALEHNNLSFPPVADNYTKYSDLISVYKSGNISKVPILEGTNAEEGNIFQLGQSNLTSFLQTTFRDDQVRRRVAAAFPVSNPNAAYHTISEIYTKIGFACPQAAHAQLASTKGHHVWRYWFDASFNNTNPLYPVGIPLGVYHSSEIGLVFQTYPNINQTGQEYALSNYMQTAWANFAKNPSRGPGWNSLYQFGLTDLAALGSNGTSGATLVGRDVADAQCDVFGYAPLIGGTVPVRQPF